MAFRAFGLLLNALNNEDRGLKVCFSLATIAFDRESVQMSQILSSQGKSALSNPYPHYLVRLATSRLSPKKGRLFGLALQCMGSLCGPPPRQETTKDPEIEASRHDQSSGNPLFRGTKVFLNTCVTVFRCKQREVDDP